MSECACLQEGTQRHPLLGSVWVLGRQAPADLLFAFPQISRQHARLEWRDGSYFLTDLGSRFGTWCQGRAVGQEPLRLADGDEVVLGGVLALRFHDPAETRDGRRLGRLKGVWMDEQTQATWIDAHLLEPGLSPAQFALLQLLLSREGEFCSREEIGRAVWPDESPEGISEDAVDGLIKRIRARLREGSADEHVEMRRGRGFRLRPPGAT